MNRRRAQAVLATELPLQASKVAEWVAVVSNTHDLLPDADPDALQRLAAIAQAYCDGKRLEAARTSRSDCRRSLQVLSDRAADALQVLCQLPVAQHSALSQVAVGEAPRSPLGASLGEFGILFQDLAEVDLGFWQVGTLEISDSTVQRCTQLMTELAERCSNFPMDAQWEIMLLDQFDNLLPAPSPDRDFLHVLIGNLSGKCQVASELMKSVRGPRSDTHRMRAVWALHDEFERGEQKATHNPADTVGHTGVGRSAFDKLVYQFFEDVGPDDTHSRGINDAISYACRDGRQARNSRMIKTDQVGQKKILDLLVEAGVTNFSPDN